MFATAYRVGIHTHQSEEAGGRVGDSVSKELVVAAHRGVRRCE
jgi:hypothetical protein